MLKVVNGTEKKLEDNERKALQRTGLFLGFVSVPEQLVSRHACSLVVEITERVLVPTDKSPMNIHETLLLSVEDYSENYRLNPDGGGR